MAKTTVGTLNQPLKMKPASRAAMTTQNLIGARTVKSLPGPMRIRHPARPKKKERMQTDEPPAAAHCPTRSLAAWLALLEKRPSGAHIDLGLGRVRPVWKRMAGGISAPVRPVAGTNGHGPTGARLDRPLPDG